ncbi:MAG: serine hydrolase [Caldilineaceae bacterium]|nr:serine hydrolase [Caldilineaceae bacterium]
MLTPQPQRIGLSPQRLVRVDNLFERYVHGGLLSGALGLIYRKGEVGYIRAFGQRDIEAGLPMTEDTIFRLYSMTKPVTALAALMLFEDGHFLLDDPIATYLPEFEDVKVFTGDLDDLEPPQRPITVKDLFMHTAGLSYGWDRDSPVDKAYRRQIGNRDQLPLETVVQRLAGLPLLYHPGARWHYSLATSVLGRLVEVLSARSLDDFFHQEIFKPLAMHDTGFHVSAGSLERFSACYCPFGGFSLGRDLGRNSRARSAPAEEMDHSGGAKIELHESPQASRFAKPPVFLSGGGGLVSTIGDYLRFAQMLLHGGALDGTRLLGRKTIEMMRANHLPPKLVPIVLNGNPNAGYGFGLGVSVLVDLPASGAPGSAGIFGWGGAATTQFWIDPAEEMLGIFMTQFMPTGHYPVTREFRVAAYQALVA